MVKGHKKARRSFSSSGSSNQTRLSCGRRWTVNEDVALREAVEKLIPSPPSAAADCNVNQSSPPGIRKREGNKSQGMDWKYIAQKAMSGHQRSAMECRNRWEKVLVQGFVKGAFSKEEDDLIRECIKEGVPRWSAIADRITGRVGKQCRERWYNHLDPSLKHNIAWLAAEDDLLSEACEIWGSCWSKISKLLVGRSANMCKNRWNGSCRRKNKGFGSNNGRSCFLTELHDDSAQLLSELVPRNSPHFSDEIEIVKTAREVARALVEELEESTAGNLASHSPDGGQGFDTDLVQISASLRLGITMLSHHMTPLAATPKCGRAASCSNSGKSAPSGGRRSGRRKALPEMEEEMPELPLPHLDEVNFNLAPESLLSPGSLQLQDYDEDNMAVTEAEEDLMEDVHFQSSAKRALSATFPDPSTAIFREESFVPVPMFVCNVSSSTSKGPFVLPRADAQCNGVSCHRHPAIQYLCPSKKNLGPLKDGARGAKSPQYTKSPSAAMKSLSPLLAPSRVPSCCVKWVRNDGSLCKDVKASVLGPYDTFTPVVIHPKKSCFKRGIKSSVHQRGFLPLDKSPIFVRQYISKLATKDGKKPRANSTAIPYERRNHEPCLDDEETPEEGLFGDENQTPVAQMVSKSFKLNMIATPVLNLGSPTFVHHNDNILSIFKTPEEHKIVFSTSCHSASPGTSTSCPNTNQKLAGSAPESRTVTFCDTGISCSREKKVEKLCALPVPFSRRNIHATLDVPGMFASSSDPATASMNEGLAASANRAGAPVKQEEHQDNSTTHFSPTRSILRGKTFSAFAKKRLLNQHQDKLSSPTPCVKANTDQSGEHGGDKTARRQLSPMSSPDISISKSRAFTKTNNGGVGELKSQVANIVNFGYSPSNKKDPLSKRALTLQQFRPTSPTFSFASSPSLFTTYHV